MIHKAQDQGMIKYNCFSCHDKPENMIKLIDTGEFDGMTVQYNLLDGSTKKRSPMPTKRAWAW